MNIIKASHSIKSGLLIAGLIAIVGCGEKSTVDTTASASTQTANQTPEQQPVDTVINPMLAASNGTAEINPNNMDRDAMMEAVLTNQPPMSHTENGQTITTKPTKNLNDVDNALRQVLPKNSQVLHVASVTSPEMQEYSATFKVTADVEAWQTELSNNLKSQGWTTQEWKKQEEPTAGLTFAEFGATKGNSAFTAVFGVMGERLVTIGITTEL